MWCSAGPHDERKRIQKSRIGMLGIGSGLNVMMLSGLVSRSGKTYTRIQENILMLTREVHYLDEGAQDGPVLLTVESLVFHGNIDEAFPHIVWDSITST